MDQLQEASDLFRIVRLCFRAVEDRFALFFAVVDFLLWLLFAKTGEETAAIEEVRRLNREDVTAEISTSDTLEEAVEYAKRRGICRIHPVGGEPIRLPLTGKGEMR